MSQPLGAAGFAAVSGVSRETLARLEAYLGLLRRWQRRINLVGAATLADPWRRHVLDSAQLMAHLPPGARSVLDLGSGAGFPGLVLALLGAPGVVLVEADRRKCTFLAEAARITAAPVTIRATRIEELPETKVDVVTARALAPLPRLLALARPFFGPTTVGLFLKGARLDEELTAAGERGTMRLRRVQSVSDPRGVILHIQGIGNGDAQ